MEFSGVIFGVLIGVSSTLVLILAVVKNKAGQLANFSEEDAGKTFFVEIVCKEAAICRVIHDNKSLWYPLPIPGSGMTELLPNESYVLSWHSAGVPMFTTVSS